MNAQSVSLSQKIMVIVRDRLNALSSQSFEQVAKLPPEGSENLIVEGTTLSLSVWHDTLNSQEHRVVVQLYKPGTLSVGRMYLDGFVVNAKDEQRALTLEEWAPFS